MKVSQSGGHVIDTTVCRLVRMPFEELAAWCEHEYRDGFRDNAEVVIAHPSDFDHSVTWTYAFVNPVTRRYIPLAFTTLLVERGEVAVAVADLTLDAVGKVLDQTGSAVSECRVLDTLDSELVISVKRRRRE